MILLVSGPSGVGKTFLTQLAQASLGYERVIAVTTRLPRPSEQDTVHYHFWNRERFHRAIARGTLVDWDYFLGNYYGYPNDLRDLALRDGDAVVPVISRMALRLRRTLPNCALLFLDSPPETLLKNVIGRGLEQVEIDRRMLQDAEEREHSPLFEHVIADASVLNRCDWVHLLDQIRRTSGRGG